MTSPRPKQSEIDRLQSIIAEFKADNAALRAKVALLEEKRAAHWMPLKSADRGLHSYNCVRVWARRRFFKTRRIGGRVFVDAVSLAEFLATRLGK